MGDPRPCGVRYFFERDVERERDDEERDDDLDAPPLLRPPFAPPFAPPFRPPARLALRLVVLPRPDPLFLPPPVSLLTVAHARCSATFFGVPRFSYPSSMCSACRFCLSVYADLS